MRVALTILAFAALPAAAQSLRYTPGEFTYTVTTVIKHTDARGEQKQTYTVTMEQRMKLLLGARDAQSMRFRLALERYTVSADLPMRLPDVSKFQGTVVEGVITPSGRMLHYTFRSPDSASAEAAALAGNLSGFLVTIPASAQPGAPVADTTSSRQTEGKNDLTERTITTTAVETDTVYAGQTARRIRRDTEVTVGGVSVQQGQALQIVGEGGGTGFFYVTPAGAYLGAHTRTTVNTQFTLPDGSHVSSIEDATSTIVLVR